jgi:hypothetical protein
MSTYRYDEDEEDGPNRAKREQRKTMSCGVMIALCLFVVGSILLLMGWLPNVLEQRKYTRGDCVGIMGRVEWGYCTGGCNGCYTDCWTVFFGVSAVPNVTVYMEQAKFAQETTAMSAMLRYVGQDLGTCYYKDGGTEVRFQLPDSRMWLVLFSITYAMTFATIFILSFVCVCRAWQKRSRMNNFNPLNVVQVQPIPPAAHETTTTTTIHNDDNDGEGRSDFDVEI